MNIYRVLVRRSFSVVIDAENPSAASSAAETFLGYTNEATEAEQAENHFKIRSMVMLDNDAEIDPCKFI
jgi:hypothetical protein